MGDLNDNLLQATQQINNNQILDTAQKQDEILENKNRYAAFEYGEQLKNRTYTVDGKQAKATKDSDEMIEVLKGIEALSDSIGIFAFQPNDEQAFRNAGEALLDQMRHAIERCDKYLVTKNPWSKEGKARYRIVASIGETISRDILGMEQKLSSFLECTEEERSRVTSWEDFLNWSRTVEYKNNVDGVSITHTGGNTSDVLIIEKGGKKQFFKKENRLHKPTIENIINDNREQLKIEENEQLKQKDSVAEIKDRFLKRFLKEFTSNFSSSNDQRTMFSGLSDTGDVFKDLKSAVKIMQFDLNGELCRIIASVDSISDVEKKERLKTELGELFIKIRKEFIGSDVGVKGGQIKAGEDLVKRNVCTYRLAQLLGLPDLVPKSEMATIEVDGKKMYGVVMEDAGGEVENDIYNKVSSVNKEYVGKKLYYSDNAIKDCFHMQLFDILCGQTDRHVGNRMFDIVEVKGKYIIKRVKGIDCDISFGETDFSYNLNYNPGVVDKNGIAIPMSESVANQILEMDMKVLEYHMLGILNVKEREALKNRFIGMQKAIRKRMEYEKKHSNEDSLFIKKGGWDQYARKLRLNAKEDFDLRKRLESTTYIKAGALNGLTMQ